jgi:hypothetical protein
VTAGAGIRPAQLRARRDPVGGCSGPQSRFHHIAPTHCGWSRGLGDDLQRQDFHFSTGGAHRYDIFRRKAGSLSSAEINRTMS